MLIPFEQNKYLIKFLNVVKGIGVYNLITLKQKLLKPINAGRFESWLPASANSPRVPGPRLPYSPTTKYS